MIHIFQQYKTAALAVTTLSLCLLSYLLANGDEKSGTVPFKKGLVAAHNDLAGARTSQDGASKAVTLSEEAVGNREHTRSVAIAAATRSYSKNDPNAGIHLQILLAMQNQKLIEQNDRIIKILENQAK